MISIWNTKKLLHCISPLIEHYVRQRTTIANAGCWRNINNLLLPHYGLLSTSSLTATSTPSSSPSCVVSNKTLIIGISRQQQQQPYLPILTEQKKFNKHINTIDKRREDFINYHRETIIKNLALNSNSRIHTIKSSQLARYLSYHTNYTTKRDTKLKMAQVISGKEVSEEIRAQLKVKVESMSIKPKLAIVQIGGREDSNVYIRMKIQFAESIGASAELIKLGRDITEEEVAKKVDELNKDNSVHGLITQLPFDCSQKIDSDRIVNLISPSKDVDGLCAYNAGKLLHGELGSDSFVPCTPNGCMELIKKSGVKIEGSRSVVIGRSKIVGSPMAQLLTWHNSTVTICHSRTKDLEGICREADIVVAAVGRPKMVKKSWIKPGAVVIDCGINVIPDATKKSGTRLVGDVDYDECKEVASAITPVPGGVGPMTVAMLISNTVLSASRREK